MIHLQEGTENIAFRAGAPHCSARGACWMLLCFLVFFFAFAFSFLFFLHAVAVAVFPCSGPLLFGTCCCCCPPRAKTFHFPNSAWRGARAPMPSKVHTQPVSMVQTDLLLKSAFSLCFSFPSKMEDSDCLVLFHIFQFLSQVAKNVTVLSFGRWHIAVQTQSNSKLQPKYSIP